MKPRRTKTGAFLIEISGEDNSQKADKLALRLQELFQDDGKVIVSRPNKTSELRITNLDDSTTPEEVVAALSQASDCSPSEVTTGDIKRARNGLGAIWIKCPVVSANRLADLKKVRIGWTSARVELLPDRGLQCYRCLQFGHARRECKNSTDRSGLCYRCGGMGHKAKVLIISQMRCV
ncbi:hypothetical protein ALC62_12670 [Cyphomyrmex costatus]|uniref:CCHC-type domain-containing protein n=2 Tax=Cyphomyrmex costatus TaxID=456900 RepID=A0A151IAV5_9HYME|nr:hypothetical protein ALC62_12670 [Cyphomyrmex costatus]